MNTANSRNNFGARRKLPWARRVLFTALMAAAGAAAAQRTNSPAGWDYNSFKIIVDRNIFNQNRMPHERTAAPPRVPDSFSLVGTMLYAGGNIAFFNGTSDQYRKALEAGGDIAGFKVTAVRLNSVTLSEGTNEMVLKVTTQLRRDDNGHWSVSAEPVSYASASTVVSPTGGRTASNHASASRSSRSGFATMSGAPAVNEGTDNLTPDGAQAPPPPAMDHNPPAASVPGGSPNDALSRLMQRRAQEEQRLSQGQ